jgi:hypothetical protein
MPEGGAEPLGRTKSKEKNCSLQSSIFRESKVRASEKSMDAYRSLINLVTLGQNWNAINLKIARERVYSDVYSD